VRGERVPSRARDPESRALRLIGSLVGRSGGPLDAVVGRRNDYILATDHFPAPAVVGTRGQEEGEAAP
jgi:hypothetical protein